MILSGLKVSTMFGSRKIDEKGENTIKSSKAARQVSARDGGWGLSSNETGLQYEEQHIDINAMLWKLTCRIPK